MDARAILDHLGCRGDGSQWNIRCPAHDDRNPSLSVTLRDGKVWLQCHAHCDYKDIVRAFGLTPADFNPESNGRHEPLGMEDARYPYHDETGQVLFQVVRYSPKTFRQYAADGTPGVKGIRKVLYHLDRLCRETPEVWVVEGEKDADRLWQVGLPATTSVGGAGKWLEEYSKQLLAAGVESVVILPDNDPPGEKHAQQVLRSSLAAGLRARLIHLPRLEDMPGGDVYAWLDYRGGSKKELEDLVEAAPEVRSEELTGDLPPAEAAGEPEKTPRLKFHPSVIERQKTPPGTWVIPDILATAGLTCLYGEPGHGKSFVALDFACHVAAGYPWLGRKVKQGKVIYFLGEGSLPLRTRAWVAGQHKDADVWKALDGNLIEVEGVPYLLNEADMAVFWKKLEDYPDTRLIVFDTLARAFMGRSENDSKDAGEVIEKLDEIRRKTGAAVLVLHHSGKDQGKGPRGSSALKGAVDTLIMAEKKEANVNLKCEKQKEREEFKPIDLVFEVVPFEKDPEGEPLSSCYIRPLAAQEKARQLAGTARKILDLCLEPENEKGVSTGYIIAQNEDVSERQVYNVLNQLVRDKLLRKTGRGSYKANPKARDAGQLGCSSDHPRVDYE